MSLTENFPNLPQEIMDTFEPLEMTTEGERVRGFPGVADRRALPDLVKIYTQRTGNRKWIEVGSFAGATALMMLHAVPDLTLYCVDTWQGSPSDATGIITERIGQKNVFSVFCTNLKGEVFDRCHPLVGQSTTYAAIWPFQVAGIFIDAEHTFERCLEDMEAWWPHVTPGGVLCGHDYVTFDGVRKAVDEFLIRYNVAGVQVHGNVWWIPKCPNPS